MSRDRRPPCNHAAEPVVSWQAFKNGKRHIRSDCPLCGRFLCYVPQTPGNVAKVNAADVKELELCK